MSTVITRYCSITPEALIFNDKKVEIRQQESIDAYFRTLYKSMGINYGKFYKMDPLCKLAFLCTETLLRDLDLTKKYPEDKIGIVVENRHASIISDEKHQASIQNKQDYYPSPSVFVYTLPNIMLGELCIRHTIKGENSCFLFPTFDAGFIKNYVDILFEKEHYGCCITGWIDLNTNNFSAHLFLIEQRTSDESYLSKFDTDYMNLMIEKYGRTDRKAEG